VLVVALMLLVMPQAMALKYTINGSLSDWGITDDDIRRGLNDTAHDPVQVGDENAWVPDVSTVKWVVEDNVDPDTPGWGTYYGVHIIGIGSSYTIYDEPLATRPDGTKVAQPYGGEPYDVEAIYLDEDSNYIYIAIIASKLTGSTIAESTGDLALNIDGDSTTGEYGYEYGVKIADGTIWQVTDWEESIYLLDVPIYISSGTKVDGYTATIATRELPIYEKNYEDYNTNNFIIEMAIPKAALGNPSGLTLTQVHYAVSCGNDQITVPEFLSILIPVGLVIGAVVYLRRSRRP